MRAGEEHACNFTECVEVALYLSMLQRSEIKLHDEAERLNGEGELVAES